MADTESNDDELFSMDELEKDLKRSRGGRRLVWFAAGLVLGIAGTVLLPRYAGPYLPFGGGGELLTGPVLSEERDGERLLLTIEAEPGAFIASFSRRVSEIALLVEPGDTVTLSVEDYEPFIEDADFEGVRKAHGAGRGDAVPGARPAAGGGAPATDSMTTPSGAIPDSATATGDTAAAVDTSATGDAAAARPPATADPDSAPVTAVAKSDPPRR